MLCQFFVGVDGSNGFLATSDLEHYETDSDGLK